MVGPPRPEFVIFGSSIVQFSFGNDGWAAHLADTYSRKADIVLRGYGGWNSNQALKVIDKIFPKDAAVQPALAIVYFGGNDAMEVKMPDPTAENPMNPHVPLPKYIENMRNIIAHLKSLSNNIRLIFLGAPPCDEEKFSFGGYVVRSNETLGEYSEALLHLCKEMGVMGVDLWNAIQKVKDWKEVCFVDGVHFTAEGSKVVLAEIMKILTKANWEPSLDPNAMPNEFAKYDLSAPSVPLYTLFRGNNLE